MKNTNLGAEIGDPSTVDNIRAIQDWQLAWSRLVAYAWENWEKEENGENIVDKITSNPEFYLKQFGYSGNFDTTRIVVVREQNGGKKSVELNNWTENDQQSYKSPTVNNNVNEEAAPETLTNGWNEAYQNNQLAGALVVVLPSPPEKDQALALSDYMAISNYQPFTCT
jgi:uncharacterized protein YbaA (DUF1428 family)